MIEQALQMGAYNTPHPTSVLRLQYIFYHIKSSEHRKAERKHAIEFISDQLRNFVRKYIVYLLFFLLYQAFHIVMIIAASTSNTYFEDNKKDGYSWIRGTTSQLHLPFSLVEIMTVGDTLEFVVLSVAALLEPYFISRYCKCLESRQPKTSIDERGLPFVTEEEEEKDDRHTQLFAMTSEIREQTRLSQYFPRPLKVLIYMILAGLGMKRLLICSNQKGQKAAQKKAQYTQRHPFL